MARYEDLSLNIIRMPTATGSAKQSSIVSLSLTPAAVAAATVAGQTLTVPGIETTDLVKLIDCPMTNAVSPTVVTASAANTVTVYYVNPTAGALTPGAGTYRFLVIKTK